MNRRSFLRTALLGLGAMATVPLLARTGKTSDSFSRANQNPIGQPWGPIDNDECFAAALEKGHVRGGCYHLTRPPVIPGGRVISHCQFILEPQAGSVWNWHVKGKPNGDWPDLDHVIHVEHCHIKHLPDSFIPCSS